MSGREIIYSCEDCDGVIDSLWKTEGEAKIRAFDVMRNKSNQIMYVESYIIGLVRYDKYGNYTREYAELLKEAEG